MARRLPMFPLSSVLFPRSVLPVQVFEPRYLRMMADVVSGDREFGVVLIERGWEVGGGDHRFDVGTVAHIASIREAGDGRLAVLAVGTHRFQVREWHPDDPYPQAIVEVLLDEDTSLDQDSLQEGRVALDRVYALASELGADLTTPDIPLDDDEPIAAMWTLCALAPIGQLDRQRLLEMTDPSERIRVLTHLLGEEAELLRAELGGS